MPVLNKDNLNYALRDALDTIRYNGQGLNTGINAMTARRDAFTSELEMLLAGAAMVPGARAVLNDAMTGYWQESELGSDPDLQNLEVIVGAGFHAAVYCAARVQMGFPKPIVLDIADADHIGGAFAVSTNGAFFLNSGNRPGLMGLPGNLDSALNYLPGAPIQPAMVSTGEYQTNADMALVIRLTLAQYATVFPNVTVRYTENVTKMDGVQRVVVATEGRPDFEAGRVIDARGCGGPDTEQLNLGDRVITFPQFMGRMGDESFPLKDLNRVAVIGDGDSARCAVESLLGIGPGSHSSVAGLDFVKVIDWFGPSLPTTCETWRAQERGRYQAISKYLPRQDNLDSPRRLTIRQEAAYPQRGLDSVLVGPDSYDLAIVCTGNTLPCLEKDLDDASYASVYRGENAQGTPLARKYRELYTVGPAAQLLFTREEEQRGVTAVPANRVAMFRLAPRTSALATLLPAVPERVKPPFPPDVEAAKQANDDVAANAARAEAFSKEERRQYAADKYGRARFFYDKPRPAFKEPMTLEPPIPAVPADTALEEDPF